MWWQQKLGLLFLVTRDLLRFASIEWDVRQASPERRPFWGVMVGWFPGCWRKKAAAKKAKYVGSLLGSFFR